MTEIIDGHLYDYPKYYDLVYGSDWKAEFQFLQWCFAEYNRRPVKRLFEPACGTGRLLIRLAEAGYEVQGNDLNPRAVEFCNARFQRRSFSSPAVVGDMAEFRLGRKVDAAFNMINSFRHLPDEAAAESHLNCVARALVKGGVYCWDCTSPPPAATEWMKKDGPRGNLAVISSMWSAGIDMRRRNERVGMTFDVYTPTRHQRIVDEMNYRTYTAPQMKRLLKKVSEFEVVETFDFTYDLNRPIRIDDRTEDVVFVLRRV